MGGREVRLCGIESSQSESVGKVLQQAAIIAVSLRLMVKVDHPVPIGSHTAI